MAEYDDRKYYQAQLKASEYNDEKQQKIGEWNMFELITSVYYGKQYYFLQDNNIVYSRASCKYLTVQDAINEFLKTIGDDC